MSPSGSSPDLFGTLQREVNRVFDQMFGGGGGLARAGGFAPSLEMKDTDTGLLVTAELPGLEETDVELSLEGDLLRFQVKSAARRPRTRGGFHLSERSYGAFRRSVRLPWAADPARASASFNKSAC